MSHARWGHVLDSVSCELLCMPWVPPYCSPFLYEHLVLDSQLLITGAQELRTHWGTPGPCSEPPGGAFAAQLHISGTSPASALPPRHADSSPLPSLKRFRGHRRPMPSFALPDGGPAQLGQPTRTHPHCRLGRGGARGWARPVARRVGGYRRKSGAGSTGRLPTPWRG
jgi:hypothetical protein